MKIMKKINNFHMLFEFLPFNVPFMLYKYMIMAYLTKNICKKVKK